MQYEPASRSSPAGARCSSRLGYGGWRDKGGHSNSEYAFSDVGSVQEFCKGFGEGKRDGEYSKEFINDLAKGQISVLLCEV